MADLQKFGKVILDFANTKNETPVPQFYKDAFLNWYGCTLAGAYAKMVDAAVNTFKAEGTNNVLPPVGRTEHLDIPKTVQIDCLSSACLAYDDIHFETTLHPAGPVLAAILGVARTQKVSGKEALQAFRSGMEVECRTALAMFAKNTDTSKCWYPTGVTGSIGAAVAAGQLLNLDAGQMESAIGLAAGYSSGTRGTHGAMSGSWVPGIAAEAGYVSAKMAKNGFTATINSLTGGNGLFNAINPTGDFKKAFEGIRQNYICETTACKPYPFGFISFAVIKCCLDLHKELKKHNANIDKVTVYVSPTALTLGKNPTPTSIYQAMVSLRYIVGRVISNPHLAFVPLDDDFTISKDISKIMEHVTICEDAALRNDQAHCSAVLSDGTALEIKCDVAPSAPGNPLTTADVEEKFMLQAEKALNKQAANTLLDIFHKLEEIDDVSILIKLSMQK